MLWLWCQTYWVLLTENPLKCLILYWSWQEFPPLNPFSAPRRSAHIKQKGAPVPPGPGWWDVDKSKMKKKEMEKPGPLGTQEVLWSGSRSCETWERQHLWKAATLQPHNRYNCPADTGAWILTWCGFCLFVGLGCLGVVLPFLQDAEVEEVCNFGKYQFCLVRVNGWIMVESHLQALSTWIL